MKNYLISEEFILLANRRKMQRSFIGRKRVKQIYTIGAMFFDLLLLDVIMFDVKGKVALKKSEEKNNHVALKMLSTLIEENEPKDLKNWISIFHIPSKERIALYTTLTDGIEETRENKDIAVEGLRAELLELGKVSDETIVLALLLKTSGTLKGYFSDYEIKRVESRINDFKKEYPEKWTSINHIAEEIMVLDLSISSLFMW